MQRDARNLNQKEKMHTYILWLVSLCGQLTWIDPQKEPIK